MIMTMTTQETIDLIAAAMASYGRVPDGYEIKSVGLSRLGAEIKLVRVTK